MNNKNNNIYNLFMNLELYISNDYGKYVNSSLAYLFAKAKLDKKVFLIYKLLDQPLYYTDNYKVNLTQTLNYQLIFCPIRIRDLIIALPNNKEETELYNEITLNSPMKILRVPLLLCEENIITIRRLLRFCNEYEEFLDNCIEYLNMLNGIMVIKMKSYFS